MKSGFYVETGKSFGEVALLSENAERNASVVADEDNMDLLVVHRDLYIRTVKVSDGKHKSVIKSINSNWIDKAHHLRV